MKKFKQIESEYVQIKHLRNDLTELKKTKNRLSGPAEGNTVNIVVEGTSVQAPRNVVQAILDDEIALVEGELGALGVDLTE